MAFLQATGRLVATYIWLAILTGHITRCVLSVVRFGQGRWRNIEVSIGPTMPIATANGAVDTSVDAP